MKRLLTISFILFASIAHAQTTTTTIVSFGGIVNCQSIAVTATRIQNGNIKTTVTLDVKECYPGETIPRNSIVFFNSPIPNSDLTTDQNGAKLLTNSPYGQINVTWIFTNDSHSSYDATWNWFTPNRIRQTQNDDFKSVHATGIIGSWTIDRNGYFTTSVFKK